MKTIEYRDLIDRKGFPPGQWDSEPDKIQFPDEATRLPCLIVRNRLGGLCGYVGVSEGHPLFGKEDPGVDVHGGVTFTGFCSKDEHGICHKVESGENDLVWWIGFDCVHLGDWAPAEARFGSNSPAHHETYRDVAYVRIECAKLATQLHDLK